MSGGRNQSRATRRARAKVAKGARSTGKVTLSLLQLCRMSDVDAVRKSLQQGGDPCYSDPQGMTPLIVAAQLKDVELARLLVDTKSYLSSKQDHGEVLRKMFSQSLHVNGASAAILASRHMLGTGGLAQKQALAGILRSTVPLLQTGVDEDSEDLAFDSVALSSASTSSGPSSPLRATGKSKKQTKNAKKKHTASGAVACAAAAASSPPAEDVLCVIMEAAYRLGKEEGDFSLLKRLEDEAAMARVVNRMERIEATKQEVLEDPTWARLNASSQESKQDQAAVLMVRAQAQAVIDDFVTDDILDLRVCTDGRNNHSAEIDPDNIFERVLWGLEAWEMPNRFGECWSVEDDHLIRHPTTSQLVAEPSKAPLVARILNGLGFQRLDNAIVLTAFETWHRMVRRNLCHYFAFAVPNNHALSVLEDYAPLFECGAGSGYWASLLKKRGVDIICYDINPPRVDTDSFETATVSDLHERHAFVRTFCELHQASGEEAAAHHPDRTLFLCWPESQDREWSPWAEDCVRAYRGEYVIYVGEWTGRASETSISHPRCGWCLRKGEWPRCGRCYAFRYCSPDCQRSAWSRHKQVCQPATIELRDKITTSYQKTKNEVSPGVTVSHAFQQYMEAEFELLTVVEIPNWPLIHDCMMVFKRKVPITDLSSLTITEIEDDLPPLVDEDDLPPLIDTDALD